MRVWDANSGNELRRMQGRGVAKDVQSLVFSPDGSRVTLTPVDGPADTWDVATGRWPLDSPGWERDVVARSPDGARLVVQQEDGSLSVREGETVVTDGTADVTPGQQVS